MPDPQAETDLTIEGTLAAHEARDRARRSPEPPVDLIAPHLDREREEQIVSEHVYDPGAVPRASTCGEHGSVCGQIAHAVTLGESNEKTALRIEGDIKEVKSDVKEIFRLLRNGKAPVAETPTEKGADAKTVGVMVGGIGAALLAIVVAYFAFVKDTRDTLSPAAVQQIVKALEAQKSHP